MSEDTIPGDLDAIRNRLDKGDKRMERLEQGQVEIREELLRNSDITSGIHELLQAARTGLKVLGGLGVAAQWTGRLATAAAAVWALIYMATHGGNPPGK